MAVCVAVVGAGRMGSVVAKQLPDRTEKIIIDIDLEKASQLAERVGGKAGDRLEIAGKADLVAVVLPTPVVNRTVEGLLNILQKGTIILNMATTARIEPDILKDRNDIWVVDAKIIGHAMSISRGEPGIVVVNCDDRRRFKLIREQLPGFHQVVQGDASLVEKINKIGSAEGIKAAVKVRKQLNEMNVPEDWLHVAIRTVCAGTMKSFTENDLGHFALELVKKIEKEMMKKGG